MRPRSTDPGATFFFLLAGIISAALALIAWWIRPAFLTYIDLKATDAMFMARPGVKPPPEVVIVAIDEKSVNEAGRWPWSRTTTARLIKALKPAKAVALDIVFSEPQSAQADRALKEAIEYSGNVTLGYFFRDDSTNGDDPEALGQIRNSAVTLLNYKGVGEPVLPLPEFSGAEINIPTIGSGAIGFGSFNMIPDDDGMYRAANLAFIHDATLYPSLALEALSLYLGSPVILHAAQYGVDGIGLGKISIPVDEGGSLALNFYGRAGTFRTIPAIDILQGRVPEKELRDKLVFVGVTETGIYDIRATPVDPLFPGVEIHATVAGNVLQGRFLLHDTRVILLELLLIILGPIMLCLVLGWVKRTVAGLFVFASMVSLAVLLCFYLFSAYDIRARAVYPAIALALSYLSSEAYRNIIVERRSRYLKKALSSYVSSQVVNEILRNPESLKLGGEKKTVTVLFSDIRGFTTLSEAMAPDALVKLLNRYLNPMTSIVFEEEGMLDKYIGDAIMAVFNAPLKLPGHPKKACAAALKMIAKLEELNASWSKDGLPRIDIGIGINTGEAVIGNMGAELRFDYTAIGDTVNLASRLEGMNKLYGSRVLASEFTHAEAGEGYAFREMDLVRVKGKEKPVVIYELMGFKDKEKDALAAEFSRGLILYREKRFSEARTIFEGLASSYDDRPSRLYATRCAEYIAAPPPPDWDGVYVAKSK